MYEFRLLNDTEKANAVWNGTFLAASQGTAIDKILYAVGDFSVEVHYNAKENKILKLISIKTPRLLEPYLRQIKLPL